MLQYLQASSGTLIIGALIGASCVTLGALVPTFASLISRRGKRSAGERSVAILTVLALDDFVGSSFAAVHDIPEFNPLNDGEFVFHTADPVLALPSHEKLGLLDDELAEETMWLGNRVSNLGNALDALDLSARNFDGFFERRKEGYATLAAQAMDLIDRLVAEYDLRIPEKPDYYRQREGFVAIVQNTADAERTAKTLRQTERTSAGSNITQLFPRAGDVQTEQAD